MQENEQQLSINLEFLERFKSGNARVARATAKAKKVEKYKFFFGALSLRFSYTLAVKFNK